MTHLKEGLQKEICLIPVNEGAHDFGIVPGFYGGSIEMLFYNDKHGHDGTCEKVLPPGNWQLIGLCSEVSEDIVNEIVNQNGWRDDFGYNDYGNQWTTAHALTALESFQSLLKHHSLNPNSTVLLIKK